MIKKLTFALAIVAGAMVAKADFLWWQVAPENGKEFSIAELYATTDDGATKSFVEGVAPVDYNETTAKGTTVMTTSSDISDYSGSQYKFFVELVNYTDDTWDNESGRNRMDMISYDDLMSQGYITQPGVKLPDAPAPSAGGWNGGAGGSAVPEPTSGMLFLLGGALMALRRRRRA